MLYFVSAAMSYRWSNELLTILLNLNTYISIPCCKLSVTGTSYLIPIQPFSHLICHIWVIFQEYLVIPVNPNCLTLSFGQLVFWVPKMLSSILMSWGISGKWSFCISIAWSASTWVSVGLSRCREFISSAWEIAPQIWSWRVIWVTSKCLARALIDTFEFNR